MDEIKEITIETGRKLIDSGEAGFYATDANPPIPHPHQYVLVFKTKTLLVPASLFNVFEGPIVVMAGFPKMIWEIWCDSEEIAALINAEADIRKKDTPQPAVIQAIDDLMPCPVTYTGKGRSSP